MLKNKILNFKYIPIVISYIIGLLITLPALQPQLNSDSYCTLVSGYLASAQTFLKDGRLFSSLAYAIADFINLDILTLSILSILLSILFLSISIFIIYKMFSNSINKNDKLKKIALYLGVFLIFYNPFSLELLLFKESFIMNLGILFITIACKILYDSSNKCYIKSFIFLFLGTTCYQGIICYFIPLSFLVILFKSYENKDIKIKNIFLKTILIFILYSLALVLAFVLFKFINAFILTTGTTKLGNIDLIFNAKQAIRLLFYQLNGLSGLISKNIFYGSLFALFLIIVINIKNIKYKIFLFYLIIICCLCILVPFIPNLGMNSSLNYTAARMTCTIGAIIGFIIVFSILFLDIFDNKILKYIFSIFIVVSFSYNSYNYFNILNSGILRYQKDMQSINRIHEKIDQYEKESGNKVQIIYHANDSHVEGYYDELKMKNIFTQRLYSIDWSMKCSVNMGARNYKYEIMSTEDKNRLFGDIEYDEFSDEQFIFEDNKLYILIY